MKKIIILALALMLALSLAACAGPKTDSTNDSKSNTSVASETDQTTEAASETDKTTETVSEAPEEKVTSDGYAKFSQVEIGMTESEVNAILGEPTKVDKAYYYYNITVNGKDLELEVWINTVSGLVVYKSGDFYKDEYRAEFADSATDLSQVDGLESGEIDSYDACVNAFKTTGFLTTIKEDGQKTYIWVNTDNGYIKVIFNADGSINYYNGFC